MHLLLVPPKKEPQYTPEVLILDKALAKAGKTRMKYVNITTVQFSFLKFSFCSFSSSSPIHRIFRLKLAKKDGVAMRSMYVNNSRKNCSHTFYVCWSIYHLPVIINLNFYNFRGWGGSHLEFWWIYPLPPTILF